MFPFSYSSRHIFFLCNDFDYKPCYSSPSYLSVNDSYFFITPKKTRRKETTEKWFNILNFSALVVFLFAMLTHVVSPLFLLPLLLSDSEHCGYKNRKFSSWFWSKMFMTMTKKVNWRKYKFKTKKIGTRVEKFPIDDVEMEINWMVGNWIERFEFESKKAG